MGETSVDLHLNFLFAHEEDGVPWVRFDRPERKNARAFVEKRDPSSSARSGGRT